MKNYKTLTFITLFSVLSFQLFSQAKTLSLDDFSGIDFRAAGNVYLQKGNQNSLRIEKNANISADDLIIEVKNNHLIIRKKSNKGNNYKSKRAAFYITYTSLEEIKFSGAGNLKTENTLKSDKLDVIFSGAGDIKLDLDIRELNVMFSGAGNMFLTGKVRESDLLMNGAGNLKASKLICENSNSILSGTGNMEVNASESLSAIVSGVGNIYYKGNPKSVEVMTSGQGEIKKL